MESPSDRVACARTREQLMAACGSPAMAGFSGSLSRKTKCRAAIKLIDPVRLTGVVVVEFDLPSIESQPFHAKADVVWSDSFAMGLRFLHIEKHSGVALQTWLGSLEAQFRLHETAQRTC